MDHARSLLLKGLIEGLILQAIEREPTHGYAILKEIEELRGEAPNKNQVYPRLKALEEEGLLVSGEEENGDERSTRQLYSLTRDGEARLREYRTLPAAFKVSMVSLFAIPAADELARRVEDEGADVEPPAPRQEAKRPHGQVEVPEGWVYTALEELPHAPEVKAPFAKVSLNRNPGTGTWVLQVDGHEPARYDGEADCPLTFLYLATQRLLFEPRA